MVDAAERNRRIEDANYKIGEAQFFLKELMSRERSRKLDSSTEFHYCFSAFLSASRSALQILCDRVDWSWIEAELASCDPGEGQIYRL